MTEIIRTGRKVAALTQSVALCHRQRISSRRPYLGIAGGRLSVREPAEARGYRDDRWSALSYQAPRDIRQNWYQEAL